MLLDYKYYMIRAQEDRHEDEDVQAYADEREVERAESHRDELNDRVW